MHLNKSPSTTLALFCKVIDNYGDIGICWRLARQLRAEHGIAVTLWVDDLKSFQRLCPDVLVDFDIQQIAGVEVRYWRDQNGVFSSPDIADIVIEFFGCDIPPAYISAMAACEPRPVWLNLEGLTAEKWVEGCHTLPSPHPQLPITKHFFFPGFTDKTGGLLSESGLKQQRVAFLSDPAKVHQFLTGLGVTSTEMQALKISLFCYPEAPVAEMFDAWQSSDTAIVCLVPQGVAVDVVQDFLGSEATPGASATRGALTVRVLPFVAQPEYDKLLWACGLNFVRGEDSFVRAQWAGKPFIWHIYPQDENLHHVKLKAFLNSYSAGTLALGEMTLAWNAAAPAPEADNIRWKNRWQALLEDMPTIAQNSASWTAKMLANGDLTSNLLKFAAVVRQ